MASWGAENGPGADAGRGVGVLTARGGRGARGRRQRQAAQGGGPGARTHSRFSWSAPPRLQASTCCWISPSSAAAAPAPRAGPRRGAQREWLGRGGVRGGPAGRGRAFVCGSRRGARGAGQPLGRPGPSGRRPLRAPRRGAALGWAPTRPRCGRGRPWLLSSAAHARCCAPSRRRPCAPRLPPPARTGAPGVDPEPPLSARRHLPPRTRAAGPAPAERRPRERQAKLAEGRPWPHRPPGGRARSPPPPPSRRSGPPPLGRSRAGEGPEDLT